MNHLSGYHYIVFLIYFILVSAYGYWVHRNKRSSHNKTKDYFPAGGSLNWQRFIQFSGRKTMALINKKSIH